MKTDESPLVFLSYQWGKQQQIKALYQRLTSMGYTVWMDIYQMGGGDSLYDKIDKGMRGCKAVVSCVTQKYSLSANCRREVSLADALKKPIIPLLLEQMKWPPDGPMSMLFTELLYINFYRDDNVQMTWRGDTFDELIKKLGQFVPVIETNAGSNDKYSSNATTVNVSVKRQDKENNSEKRTIKTGDRKPSSVTVIPKDKNESEGKPNSSNTTKTDSKTVTDINTSDPKNKSKANVKSNSKENEEQTTVGRETNKRTYIRNASKVDPSDSKKPTTKAFATTVINSKAVKRKGAEDNVSSKAKLSENTTGQGQSTLINKTGNKDSNAKSGQAAVNKNVKSDVAAVNAFSKDIAKGKPIPSHAKSISTNEITGTASGNGLFKPDNKNMITKQTDSSKEPAKTETVVKKTNQKLSSVSKATLAVSKKQTEPRKTNAGPTAINTKLQRAGQAKKQPEQDRAQIKNDTSESKSRSCIIL